MAMKIVFVIGAPRSGTTMLERMLSSHSQICGGPEPHLLTPLAHLGYWAKVDKAPYDPILAAEAQRLFVERLPNGEQDYWRACRAYCDVLYGQHLATSSKSICLDKTPAYALILPFLTKVFPDAAYIVLTRHPVALFASYANSFFDGNYPAAYAYNPILQRYVPALAAFLRQHETPYVHVRYEDLVKDPQREMERVYTHIGIPFEHESIEYGKGDRPAGLGDRPAGLGNRSAGLGDPVNVAQHSRPTTLSVNKWVTELATNQSKRTFMQEVVARLDPDDLATIGYPLTTLWKPLEEVQGQAFTPHKTRWTPYRIQRKLILTLRAQTQKGGIFRKILHKIQLVCDVLLRER